MKKLFFFIPALLLSLLANSAVININNSTPNAVQTALNSAASGDEIVMAAGIYEESGNYLAFTGKELTVRAAEGAEVIIQTVCPVRLKEGAKAEFINVKFDCSTIGSYDYVIVAADDTENKRVVLTGCEFYGWAKEKAMIEATSSRRLDAITINNCYFHDCMKSVVFVENTGYNDLSITNSTFANITTSENFSAGVIDSRATSGSLLVDHCTFYNVEAMNTDYAAIGKVKLPSGAVVSNCIFALSAPGASSNRTIRDVVAANNCLVYNYTTDSGYGMQSNVTKTGCFIADPLFTNAVGGDFSYPGNWVTMNFSPARGAATDGSDLGDPRWYSAETLPSVDFATPYQFVGAKALLAGKIWYDSENDYLYGDGGSNKDYGTATWKFHAEKAGVVGVAANLNSGNTSGHKLRVEVLDADGNSVGEFAEQTSTLPGTLIIPAAGDYKIILHDDQTWSSAKIDNVTLSYIGGDIQNMPGTTDINDAWFSSNGTRADGKISYTSIGSGCWAKWNIAVASAGTYNVIVNIQNEYGHNYTVEFLKEGSDTPISVSEGATTYGHDATLYPVEVGAIALEAGNYVMTVSNSIGDAALLSTTLAYAGGGVIEFGKDAAASLLANADAIVSSDWSIEGGKITHAESKATTGWAKWNVDCADYGNYNVTINISSDNGHGMKVEIFEDEAESAIYTLSETSYSTGDLELDLGNIVLDDREYVVKVSNTVSSSHAEIASIAITYLNGAQATLPATCTFPDLMLSEKAHITEGNLWFNTIGDSNPVGQWAKWNVKVASAGTFLFTMNVSSTNGQSYKISILDGETEIDAFESGSVGSGDKEVKHYFNLAAGNYTVKLENTYAWSQGHIVSLVVTQPSLLTIDEAATSNTVIHNNYRNGNHDIQIIRTITSDMYNTICLPFDVTSAQLQAIFGADVELRQMASATLSGDVLTLNFDAATSIYRGTPYLIKTTKAVVNPVFTDVEIKEETGQATSGDNANFVGSFIKGTVPAGEDNLFLGANDLLYFSEAATTIKGMRAYFQIHDVPSGAPIRQARIVEQGNVVTALEFVNGEWQEVKSANGTIKTIENGQLILIRDGKRYNVMGVRF